MVQEMERIVSEECDNGPVCRCRQIQEVAEEFGSPVVVPDHREKDEL